MSDLPVETTPGVAAPAHEAARGQIVYITEHGERLAAIVPAAVAADVALQAGRAREATVHRGGRAVAARAPRPAASGR